jgi:hypothetical protein
MEKKTEKLTMEEQETIVNFCRADSIAEVYTHEPAWIRRLDRIAKEFPGECTFREENGFGGRTYDIPKRLVTIKMPASEALRQQRRDRLRQTRALMGKKTAE